MKNLPINFDSSTVELIKNYANSDDASVKFKNLASSNTGITYIYANIKRMANEEGWTDESKCLPHIEEKLM